MPISTQLQTLWTQLQARYPTSCLCSELLMIHQEQFLVRAIVQVGTTTMATAMAAAADLEAAEDRAKLRVLEFLGATSARNIAPISPSASTFLASAGSDISRLGESPWQGGENAVLSDVARAQPIAHQPIFAQPAPGEDLDWNSSFLERQSTEPHAPMPRISEQNLAQPTEAWSEPLGLLPEPALEKLGVDWDLPHADRPIEQLVESSPTGPVPSDSSVPIATAPSSSGRASKPNKSAKQKVGLPETPDISIPPSPNLSPNLADRSEEIMKIGIEMKRLGWSTEQGREYLKRTYGKRSRQELEDAELLDFLRYLELQPSPMQTPF